MGKTLNIRSITFKAGSSPQTPKLFVKTPSVTIIVGPNNSGKSKCLREIESWCIGQRPVFQLIEGIECEFPENLDAALKILNPLTTEPPPGQTLPPGHLYIHRASIRSGENPPSMQLNPEHLKKCLNEGNSSSHIFQTFVRFFTLRLDGRTRFDLVADKPSSPLDQPSQNLLGALFKDDISREKVRKFTEKAFSSHFVIDITGLNTFRIRLSPRKPSSSYEEQAVDHKAREFHKKAPLINEFGDGVCAAIGLVSAVMTLEQRIMLIDEPEAFLHPTLARQVGHFLTNTAREREASLVIATHSADFLMGCIQASPTIRLVRLTYSEQQPTARSIAPDQVANLVKDPLLRSTNALRSLFHRAVIVTEGDKDRAFYEEINHRLLEVQRGITDSLFINAQNCQTIPRITLPLRKLGIPAAAIFDLDVLWNPEFKSIWSLLHLEEPQLASIRDQRDKLIGHFDDQKKEMCKNLGINALDKPTQIAISEFIKEMTKYGIFFVPVGELEQWLSYLQSEKPAKPRWLPYIFDQLKADPSTVGYVHPTEDDVWGFIDQIETWVSNPNRLGIPT